MPSKNIFLSICIILTSFCFYAAEETPEKKSIKDFLNGNPNFHMEKSQHDVPGAHCNLSHQNLTCLDGIDSMGPIVKKIVSLDVSNNQISHINSLQLNCFSDQLSILDLSSNKIRHILPGVFAGISPKAQVDLRGNNIPLGCIQILEKKYPKMTFKYDNPPIKGPEDE